MRLSILSQRGFVLKSLEEQVLNLRQQGKPSISPTIEFGLVELVRQEMQTLAQRAEALYEEEELLEKAIQRACRALQNRIELHGSSFSCDPYLPGLRHILQSPAKQIAELGRNRLHAEQFGSVPRVSGFPTQAIIPYEIFEIRHWDLSYGLVTYPLVDQFELELVQDGEHYTLYGEWFPFALSYQDLEFNVGHDGSVFIALSRLPGEYALTALSRLFHVCEMIYRKASASIPVTSNADSAGHLD